METNNRYLIPATLLIAAVIVSSAMLYSAQMKTKAANMGKQAQYQSASAKDVALPIEWGDLGARLMDEGVIDREKFAELYRGRGGLSPEEERLLSKNAGEVVMTEENADLLLNLLWAFGLGNKNDVLDKGEMMDPKYKGAGNFASTGGWSLASGNPMDHYSMHSFVTLTPEQQKLVENVSKNIYRPCCNNSTHFPDCNHGMAMLGLLELMAANGVSEEEMYRVALGVNRLWFPSHYETIDRYLAEKGVAPENVEPKTLLGFDYSSGSGFRKIMESTKPAPSRGGGGGCSV